MARYHVTIEHQGTYWCTGVLVNNTAQDDKPYFLTAFHCFDEPEDSLLSDSEKAAAATMVIYWNYQASTCGSVTGSEDQNQSGAVFRAGYWSSDFALVELDDMPPRSFNVYYAGWDRSNDAPSTGVAIHHPKADTKKISIENEPLSKIILVSYDPDVYYGAFFKVGDWDVGIVEIGSSGCPLFNSNKRIVGLLSNGVSDCATRGPDFFGPLYRSWTGGASDDTRLRDWLDPLNTGVEVLDGKNPKGPCTGDTYTSTIGTGTSAWNYPMRTGYEDSRTQVIYLADEIGTSGAINALALDFTKVPGQTLKKWTIRLKHTSMTEHCSLDATDWTVMYQNDEAVNSTGWRTFDFQTPFEYNGQDNLMVDFSYNNRSSSSNGMCSSHLVSVKRSVCAQSDSLYDDPLNWSGTSRPNVWCRYERPNVKLTICKENLVVFEDTFPTTTIDETKWTAVEGATVDAEGLNEPSSEYSLRLNSGDSVKSKVIDLSSYSGATLTYHYQGSRR